MIQLAAVLILSLFLQSTLIGLNLVFLILISRSFIVEEKKNYYLAFLLGLGVAFLTGEILGILSLWFLLTVKIIYLVKKLSFGSHWLVIFLTTFILLLFKGAADLLLFKNSFELSLVFIQTILAVPIFLGIKFWEERFIPKKEIRLKLRR